MERVNNESPSLKAFELNAVNFNKCENGDSQLKQYQKEQLTEFVSSYREIFENIFAYKGHKT